MDKLPTCQGQSHGVRQGSRGGGVCSFDPAEGASQRKTLSRRRPSQPRRDRTGRTQAAAKYDIEVLVCKAGLGWFENFPMGAQTNLGCVINIYFYTVNHLRHGRT